MGSKNKAKKVKDENAVTKGGVLEKKEAKEHIGTLRKLQDKDPEFYEYLKEHDKDLLEFDEEDLDDNDQTDGVAEEDEEEETDLEHSDDEDEKEKEPSKKVLTSDMVDSWCNAIRDDAKVGAVRSLLRAFRSACHYGDDNGDDPSSKFSTMSSSVFNKIMLFVLNEMDGILRGLLKLPPSGGKKEMIMDLMTTRRWKNYNNLVKSYLGNALHVLNQMTDNEMIAFMLRRLKYSSLFLGAFPALQRKYIKVAVHFWGTGSGALPVVSFLFLRDTCIRLGSDCLDECIRQMYKAYVVNCHFVNLSKLQHIQFLSNCFTELLRVDLPSSYQHAFSYIRQLAMILKDALSNTPRKKKSKTKGKDEPSNSKKEKVKGTPSGSSKKETYSKVYRWKFINCLELWTNVVCAYSSEPDLKPLAYPLAQIITGTARLVTSACYFPVRLRCVRMLNRISASTCTFIPVSLLLMDMLEIKELRRPPSQGVDEKAMDLFSTLKVSKSALKTRYFQEACVFSVVEELAEHLSQWSYSIGFMELSFVPGVRLRNFYKSTKVKRFLGEIKRLIHQIEANLEFINQKRATISFLPNNPAAETFLEDEKRLGSSPLSKYTALLRQRAQKRNDALMKSSVLVGDGSSKLGNKVNSDDDDDNDDEYLDSGSEESGDDQVPRPKNLKIGIKRNTKHREEKAADEDIVEDLVLSSDDDDNYNLEKEDSDGSEAEAPKSKRKQPTPAIKMRKKGKAKPSNRKWKKRKTA